MRSFIYSVVILLFCSVALQAAPVAYEIDTKKSKVGFIYAFDTQEVQGSFPVKSATLALDFSNVSRSKIDVLMSAKDAKGGLPFATQALRGPKMLDVKNNPDIHFVSSNISGTVNKAKVSGNLTMAGVTRKIVLDAGIFRTAGSDPDDLSRITVILTGEVDRYDFEMDGFPDLVDGTVKINIRAVVERAE